MNPFSELKAIASCFYEAYNRRDLEKSFENFIATDLINHTMEGCLSREMWLEFDSAFLTACPDLLMTVKEQFVEGNRVVTHWACTGTHTVAFYGMPPSGNAISLRVIAIDGFENGKIKEHLAVADFTKFMHQFENK